MRNYLIEICREFCIDNEEADPGTVYDIMDDIYRNAYGAPPTDTVNILRKALAALRVEIQQ